MCLTNRVSCVEQTVTHLAGVCGGLAKKLYTSRHDSMGKRIYWELCKKYANKCANKLQVPHSSRASSVRSVRHRAKDVSRESEEVRHPRCDRMPADNCTSWHGAYPQNVLSI